MARNERTSARVAKIAAKVMASNIHGKSSGVVLCWLTQEPDCSWKDPLTWRDIRALAASALTQVKDKRDRDDSQMRKALRGKLGARIKSVRNERWPQQRVLKRGP
jgi:hypothetical protein